MGRDESKRDFCLWGFTIRNKLLRVFRLFSFSFFFFFFFTHLIVYFRKWSSPWERRWSPKRPVRRRSSAERRSANSWTDSSRTRPTINASETGSRCVWGSTECFQTWTFCACSYFPVLFMFPLSNCILFPIFRLTWTSSRLLRTSLYEHWWHQCASLLSYVSMTNTPRAASISVCVSMI